MSSAQTGTEGGFAAAESWCHRGLPGTSCKGQSTFQRISGWMLLGGSSSIQRRGCPKEGKEPPKRSQWGHLGHPGVLPPLAKCDSLLLGEARRPEKVMLPQALLIPMLTISWIGQLLPCGLVGALGGDQRTQGPSWYFRVLT